MSSWFSRNRSPKPTTEEGERLQLPDGMWRKCPSCTAIIYAREVEKNNDVCPKCEYHWKLSAANRIALIADRQTFEDMDAGLRSTDPLTFKDSKRYRDRLKDAEKKTGEVDAIRTGRARLESRPIMLGVFNNAFIGGSMGEVVGEKLVRMIELGTNENRPVIIVSASGGARMQEGIYSLMQMARVTFALTRLADLGLPYISVLTDPTTGGVAASFAMLGDIIVAEPGAMIGFAGPRVIEQTIRKKLPDGFQTSEFLLEHGMIDMITPRNAMRDRLIQLLDNLTPLRAKAAS